MKLKLLVEGIENHYVKAHRVLSKECHDLELYIHYGHAGYRTYAISTSSGISLVNDQYCICQAIKLARRRIKRYGVENLKQMEEELLTILRVR